MSEQQFTIVGEEYVGYMQGNAYIISNGECKFSLWEKKEDAQKVCDYLNELSEENEQLRKDKEQLKEREIMEALNNGKKVLLVDDKETLENNLLEQFHVIYKNGDKDE